MNLDPLKFELKGVVGTAELPIEAYLELRIGDILLLDRPIGEPFDLKVENEVVFRGKLGLCESKKAVRIDERIYIRRD